MLYGYARVSSETQSYDGQIEALKAASVGQIFAEKFTGKAAADRRQLQALLGKVREGDVIVVTKLDRSPARRATCSTCFTTSRSEAPAFARWATASTRPPRPDG
jgi:DNA invertase Pin-like site-specific DNA recombinase